MGLKDEASSSSPNEQQQNDLNKMQQKAFETLDKEYAFARMATHTHRGMGLGFISHATEALKQPTQHHNPP